MLQKIFILLLVIGVALATIANAQDDFMLSRKEAIISVERIWERATHNAFTDLIYHHPYFYCCFREGSGHIPGIDGSVRVLCSADGQNWKSVTHFYKKNVDLRDPKLSVTPKGDIMVLMGGSVYQGGDCIKRSSWVSFSGDAGKTFSPLYNVEIDQSIRSNNDWLWRVTWHEGVGYGVVYQGQTDSLAIHLLQTKNGISYSAVTTWNLSGRPNETTLQFDSSGNMIALVRREGGNRHGMIGKSSFPYTEWTWHELAFPLGGPDFVMLDDSSAVCGTRDYRFEKTRTILARILPGAVFRPLFALPSAGDTSYPGMVIKDDVLYVSYYSSHEQKTAVYFAKIRLDAIK
ncbi:hypothetical protein GF407_01510 [candidate division KSB1 bacterium]|nr:hypothetical protein [candidate division KSB1 bacterium]